MKTVERRAPDFISPEETADERRLRHDERRRIRAASAERAALQDELASLKDQRAAFQREADDAVARTAAEVERLQAEFEAAGPAERSGLARQLADANREHAAAAEIVKLRNVHNRWGGVSQIDGRVPAALHEKITDAEERLSSLPTEADLGRTGAGDPNLMARIETIAGLLQNFAVYLREPRQIAGMTIDRNKWDNQSVAIWRRKVRQARAKIEIVEGLVNDLTRMRDRMMLEAVNETED